MKCGIVGLPNVGKSTLFQALTAIQVPAENYPFCTIEPNVGVVQVPDPRMEKLATLFNPEKLIYPVMEFVDIAGLVKGAHKGEGLGHRFLSHIRESQALLHVVRCFEDKQTSHVFEKLDPCRDIEIIESELILSDLTAIENRISKIEKLSQNQKELRAEVSLLKNLSQFMNQGHKAFDFKCSKEDQRFITTLHLLTLKPCLYVCNIHEDHLSYAQTVQKKMGEEKTLFISSRTEAEMASLPPEEKKEFLNMLDLKEPALARLIRKSYQLLNLITFFTAGKKEVKAWTVPMGSTAPQAGGVIHSDFEKGFIRAEVYTYEDLMRLGSVSALKEKGLFRIEGKNYTIQDGDILFFRFNT